jgi:hypothetical protein
VCLHICGKHIWFLSLYMPDSWKPYHVFEAAIQETDALLVTHVQESGPAAILFAAGDFNVQMPASDGVVGAYSSTCQWNERSMLMSLFASKWNLSWASTFMPLPENSPPFTHIDLRDKSKRVLDYVCCTETPAFTTKCCMKFDVDFNSDHTAISFTIFSNTKKPRRQRKQFGDHSIHWSPLVGRTVGEYFESAAVKETLESGGIEHLQHHLKRCHEILGMMHPRRPKENIYDSSVLVQNAFAALAEATSPDEIKQAAKSLYRAKRSVLDQHRGDTLARETRANLKTKHKSSTKVAALKCGGALSVDRSKWDSEAFAFYSKLYKDTSACTREGRPCIDPAERERLIRLQRDRIAELKLMHEIGNHPRFAIPAWVLLETRALFVRKASTAPGLDGITWKFLGTLPNSTVVTIGKIFERRVNAFGADGAVADWSKILVRLIPKTTDPQEVKDFRPISLSSCVQKWFCSILVFLLEEFCRPLSPECIGFRRHKQTLEVIEPIRHCFWKSAQWRTDACVLQADVSKAFDHLNHDVIKRSLLWAGCPPGLAAAVLCELSACECYLKLHEEALSESILLFGAGRQGSSDTPSLWTRVIDHVLALAQESWRAHNLGFELNDGQPLVTHVYWADDIYLIARDPAMIGDMFETLSTRLREFGLTWKESSLQLLSTDETNIGLTKHLCDGTNFYEVPFKKHLDVLGVRIDSAGGTHASVHHRAGVLFGHWAHTQQYFCSRRIPLKFRIERWYASVGRAFLYGAGGWRLTSPLAAEISRWEKGCLRQMSCRSKEDNETWRDYYARVDKLIENARASLRILPLGQQACVAYFGWAGHVGRLEPSSICLRFMCWRSLESFRIAQCSGVEPSGASRALLPSAGRPVWWDGDLEAQCGMHWREHAQNRRAWASRKFEMAAQKWLLITNKTRCQLGGDLEITRRICYISPRSVAVADVAVQAGVQVLCMLDNLQVAQQCSGVWRGPTDPRHASAIERARWVRRCLELNAGVPNWSGWPLPFIHLQRSENAAADIAARNAREGSEVALWRHCGDLRNVKLLIASDGSVAGGRAGAGAAIFLYRDGASACLGALAGVRLLDSASSVDAEFEGAILGLLLCIDFLKLHSLCRGTGDGSLHVLRQ